MTQPEEIPRVHKISVSYAYPSNNGYSEKVPHIKLSGKWLKNAGFEIGDTCYVTVDNNRLVVSKNSTCQLSAENSFSNANRVRENVATFVYTVNQFQKQMEPYTKGLKKLIATLDDMNRHLNVMKLPEGA